MFNKINKISNIVVFLFLFLPNLVFGKNLEDVEIGSFIIVINWIWFLGIMGSLILIAYFTNGRFTKIETNMDWVIKGIKGLKIDVGNQETGAFKTESPAELTDRGGELLNNSGLKDFIDSKKNEFCLVCKNNKEIETAYDVQKYAFDLLDNYRFDENFIKKLKQFSFEEGVDLDIIRRVAGIYLRNLCLEYLGLNKVDIDKDDPSVK